MKDMEKHEGHEEKISKNGKEREFLQCLLLASAFVF